MAQARLAILDKLPLLDETVEVETLAKMLVDKGPLPMKATVDAAHIAIAAFYGMDYLLTWNCKHIANARMWPGVAMICRRHGYEPPFICTPAELLGV